MGLGAMEKPTEATARPREDQLNQTYRVGSEAFSRNNISFNVGSGQEGLYFLPTESIREAGQYSHRGC